MLLLVFGGVAIFVLYAVLRSPRISRADRARTEQQLAQARATLRAAAEGDQRAADALAESYARERRQLATLRKRMTFTLVTRGVLAACGVAFVFFGLR
jgi:hypothetical protein